MEKTNEEKLDKLAMIKYPCNCSLDETYCDCCMNPDLRKAYKAGFREREKIMTKEEIRAASSIGLSEDIDGEFYTIYDFDKLYDMVVAKSVEWISKKTSLDTGEYKRFMEDKETPGE